MSNRKLKIKKKTTRRGFALWTFEDDYGMKCSIQESSLVEPHIWLGADKPMQMKGNDMVELPDSMIVFARMRLNQKQARQLAEELMYFAENGEMRR